MTFLNTLYDEKCDPVAHADETTQGGGGARTNASLFVSGLTVNRYATLNEAGCWKDVSLDALRCMGVTSGLRNADEISAGASRTGKEETSSSNATSLQKHKVLYTQDASHLNNV